MSVKVGCWVWSVEVGAGITVRTSEEGSIPGDKAAGRIKKINATLEQNKTPAITTAEISTFFAKILFNMLYRQKKETQTKD
jgi:hypothetical protein